MCPVISIKYFRLLILVISILFPQLVLSAPVQVALIAGFSADNSNTATKMCRGADVFFSLHKEAVKHLSIQHFDNSDSPKKAIDTARNVFDQGIKYIIGLPQSNDAIPISKFVSEKDMLFISPLATNKTITINNRRVFRIRYSDNYQSKVIAKYIHDELKAKKLLVLINVESTYSIGLADYLSIDLSDTKGYKVKIKKYYYDKVNIKYSELTKIINRINPDVVFIPDYSSVASLLIRHIHNLDKSIIFMGADAWNRKEIFNGLNNVKSDIELIHSTDWYKDLKNDTNKKYTARFKKLFPAVEPDADSALTYDSLCILWSALKIAKNKEDVDEIIEIIENNKFNVTSGLLSYHPNIDHDPKKNIYILKFDTVEDKELLLKKYETF